MLIRVLLVSDLAEPLDRLRGGLPPDALLCAVAPPELEAQLAREPTDVVLLRAAEIRPSGDLVRAIRDGPDRPEVIVLVDGEDPAQRAGLLAAGCLAVVYEGLPEPLFGETLTALIERSRGAERPELATVPAPFRLRDYVSASPAMKRFLRLAGRAAMTESTLLLLGETGVGKEWLARSVHAESRRRKAPFVGLSCAALPETLLESELFGHDKGAFTGALRARRGLFELADGGTLFLDEIGELPLHLQAKLLRVLDEPSIRPLGSERSVTVDVRIMAATNRDLVAEVRAGRFRQDLFYRLDVLTLALPPLRERREDIPDLVDGYRQHFCLRLGRNVWGVERDAMDALVRYHWPGNVRELINAVERAVLLTEDVRIRLGDLPGAIAARDTRFAAPAAAATGPDEPHPDAWLARPWREVRSEVIERAERRYLSGLLRACDGRLWEVAQRAGIERRSLFDKMRRYELRKEDFRKDLQPRRSPGPDRPPPRAAPRRDGR